MSRASFFSPDQWTEEHFSSFTQDRSFEMNANEERGGEKKKRNKSWARNWNFHFNIQHGLSRRGFTQTAFTHRPTCIRASVLLWPQSHMVFGFYTDYDSLFLTQTVTLVTPCHTWPLRTVIRFPPVEDKNTLSLSFKNPSSGLLFPSLSPQLHGSLPFHPLWTEFSLNLIYSLH